MQAADKKRPKEEKDIVHRLRPFAKLQSAADYEVFCADIVCKSYVIPSRSAGLTQFTPQDEAMLRKRIQELQTYRRLGLRSAGDIEKYDADLAKRVYRRLILVTRFSLPDFLFPRCTRGRQCLAIGIPQSEPNGMDQHVNHPSRTREDQKDPNLYQNRAVKRMALLPVNLVSQPPQEENSAIPSFCSEMRHSR